MPLNQWINQQLRAYTLNLNLRKFDCIVYYFSLICTSIIGGKCCFKNVQNPNKMSYRILYSGLGSSVYTLNLERNVGIEGRFKEWQT